MDIRTDANIWDMKYGGLTRGCRKACRFPRQKQMEDKRSTTGSRNKS